MDKRAAIVLIVIFGGLFLALFGFLGVAMQLVREGGAAVPFSTSGNVGVVEVKGPIRESEQVVEDLTHFREDDRIRAVVLRVDSPGGSVGPSQEIYSEVQRLAKEKVVVVSMGGVAASGGYYLSLPATRIVANPGTITGSIGVISQVPNVRHLADKVGFQMNTVTSGAAKDAGNPFRPFTEKDRELFQELIDDIYRQFVQAVSENREIPLEEAEGLADGRVYSGLQAQERGLVDALGNFTDAVELAAALAEIEGKPRLAHPPRRTRPSFRILLNEGLRESVRAVADELEVQLRGEGASVQYRLR